MDRSTSIVARERGSLFGWALPAAAGSLLMVACSSSKPLAGANSSSGSSYRPPARCEADASACIRGTVASMGFSIASSGAVAKLFRTLPSGAQIGAPDLTETVAGDGTWSFDTSVLDAGPSWAHYYVQLTVQFGLTSTVSRVIGPLASPAPSPIAVKVLPVRLVVVQSRGVDGGAAEVQSVSARIFDPATGLELMDGAGTVTFTAGATSVVVPWTGTEYALAPSPPLGGQAAYTFAIAHPSLGGSATTWNLRAATPPSGGKITSPGPTAHVGPDPLTVTWQPDPAADYVEVAVFGMGPDSCGGAGASAADQDGGSPAADGATGPIVEADGGSPASDAGGGSSADAGGSAAEGGGAASGGYVACYVSAGPDSPEVTSEAVPADDLKTGVYLLNVAFSNAACPATSDGCVYGATVAAQSVQVVRDGGS